MKTFKFIVFTSCVLLSAGVTYKAFSNISSDITKWESENDCISQQVSLGVERKNIIRDNGHCYIAKK